jgi:putative DNA primase/helicase
VVGQADIEDKFNDWVSRKLLLLANEVVARQELFHQKNKLKALITDDTIRINPKNVAAHYESNHMNMVFLSNEAQPVVLDADDRRYMAIWTPKKRDKAFYREVMDEIADGGVEALHQYLLDLDLGDFDNGCLPLETRARKALIEVSKESPDRFIEAWMNGELEHACKACSLSDLYRVYERWCRTEGERFSYAKNKFSARIHIYDEIEIAKKPVLDSSGKVKVLRVVLPDADQKPDEATWQTWLGECVASFKRDIEPDGGM